MNLGDLRTDNYCCRHDLTVHDPNTGHCSLCLCKSGPTPKPPIYLEAILDEAEKNYAKAFDIELDDGTRVLGQTGMLASAARQLARGPAERKAMLRAVAKMVLRIIEEKSK